MTQAIILLPCYYDYYRFIFIWWRLKQIYLASTSNRNQFIYRFLMDKQSIKAPACLTTRASYDQALRFRAVPHRIKAKKDSQPWNLTSDLPDLKLILQ